ncbi:PREDICTED: uncharacterized protein LOC101298187 isoform 2 [Fragaria vesca subsp. vesca]
MFRVGVYMMVSSVLYCGFDIVRETGSVGFGAGEVYGVVEQPGSCDGSFIAHVQVDERSRGEAVSDRLPYCYGSPSKATGSCSYQRLSTHAQVHERSQVLLLGHQKWCWSIFLPN